MSENALENAFVQVGLEKEYNLHEQTYNQMADQHVAVEVSDKFMIFKQ